MWRNDGGSVPGKPPWLAWGVPPGMRVRKAEHRCFRGVSEWRWFAALGYGVLGRGPAGNRRGVVRWRWCFTSAGRNPALLSPGPAALLWWAPALPRPLLAPVPGVSPA